MEPVEVQKGRTVIVPVSVGFDVSQDTISSEIRVGPNKSSNLIASWEVSFETDGTDGQIILTLDDSITSDITQSVGYMDIKRVSGGEPFPIFNKPIEVSFINCVTE